MPIDSITTQPSPTRATPASNVGEDTQASNVEMRSRPSTPLRGGEQFANLSRQGFSNGSPPDFAPPNHPQQSPVASAEEPSAIPLARKRTLELQKKSGPLEKAKNADEAKPIADVLVAELSPPVASFEECQELIEQLWDLNKLEGADEINRLGDGPYLQLVNAIMRYREANNLAEAPPVLVVQAVQPTFHETWRDTFGLELDRRAAGPDSAAAREIALMTELLRNGGSADEAIATRAAAILANYRGHNRSPVARELASRIQRGASVEQAVNAVAARYDAFEPDLLDRLREVAVQVASDMQRDEALTRPSILRSAMRPVRGAPATVFGRVAGGLASNGEHVPTW